MHSSTPSTWQSDTAKLLKVIVKPARDAYLSEAKVSGEWQGLNYPTAPDFAYACKESEQLISTLESLGVEVLRMPSDAALTIDSIYVRDTAIVCDNGVILCNMGKPARVLEPGAMQKQLAQWGIPLCGAISGEGRIEGGDVAWVDSRTLAVARGYRTNDEGIRQLRALLGDCIDELIVVPLPHFRGPGDVFHLMSIFSPVDKNLALVYSKLMPIPFREALLKRGMQLVEVAEQEYDTLGCNVLAVAPRVVIMCKGSPITRARLEAAGVTVHEYEGSEISVKGEGGPTCLTRPLQRQLSS